MMPVSGRRRGGAALPANTDKILELVFTGGTALAGLILIFLGAVFTSYDSYQPEQQADVAIKYKNRALISLIGFSALMTWTCFSSSLRRQKGSSKRHSASLRSPRLNPASL